MSRESDESQAEADWLAFRYAAGELSAEDAMAVERQMADDQALREAVSRAVALGLALASARPAAVEPVVRYQARVGQPRRFRLRPWARAGAGLAASVALLLGAYLFWHGGGDRPALHPMAGNTPIASAKTVENWLALRKAGDGTRQLESRLSDWEQDEPTEPAFNQRPAVPHWVIELAMTGAERGKHD